MKFTLDNNCIIAITNNEPAADPIRRLALAHSKGQAEVAVLGISASERQQGGRYLEHISEFRAMLNANGLGHLTIYKPTAIRGMTFWDWAAWATEETLSLERQIHDVMFPASEFDWQTVASAAGEELESTAGPAYRRYRNKRCDVQGMLAHIMNGGDIFVSSDGHFLDRREALIRLGARDVLCPLDAMAAI